MNRNNIIQFCQQYGFTSEILWAKLGKIDAPCVIANSIPKSGTNLLIRALYLLHPMHRLLSRTINDSDGINNKILGLKKGQFLAAHLKYSQELEQCFYKNAVKNILMVRDPRDIAVSNYIYITHKDPKHRLHKYFSALKSDQDRLTASIQGIESKLLSGEPSSLSLAEHFKGYLPWKNSSDCLIVRFEDIVGSKGGGDDNVQLETMMGIVEHIGLSILENDVRKAALQIFNPNSRTFVKGQIGTWEDAFEPEHKEMVKNEMNSILITLGYEKDGNW